ncbi:hypothetical protein ACJJTC_009009 [Scirpophaga incertulas]
MSEQILSIKFVLEVEKHPCLYNCNLPEYSTKDVIDKAWSDIGNKFNMSAAECKEKWRNIRAVFIRNLKANKKGSRDRRKPYYLRDVMKFTLPYIQWPKGHEKSVKLKNRKKFNTDDSEDDDSDAAASQAHVSTDSKSVSELCDNHIASPQSHPEPPQSPQSPRSPSPSDLPSILLKEKTHKTRSALEGEFKEYLKTKLDKMEKMVANQDLDQQPKKMFLLSLLPDLETMSDRQMRGFKIGAMKIIEDILIDKTKPSRPKGVSIDVNNSQPDYYEGMNVEIENTPDK